MNDELRAAFARIDWALQDARAAMEGRPMNDELRAAFARIDWALQDARAALEPEPPTVVQRMIDACREGE